MSSENDPPQKPSAASLADVFKTLASGRRKSLSPLSASDSPSEFSNHGIDGRRGSRVTFGFEGMSRGTMSNSSLDHSAVPSYETALENLKNPVLALAVEEVEVLTKHSTKFTPEQIISLWEASSYLLCQPDFEDARQRASRFLSTIVGRSDLSTDLKTQLCKSILAPTPADVVPARVNALILLSDNGRKLDIMQVNILPALGSALYSLFKAVANLRSKAKKSKQRTIENEESYLENLFDFILNVITLQNVPLEEKDAAALLEEVLKICKKTASPDDLKSALSIFDAIISCAEVPDNSFVPLLEVLCGIHASVKTLSGRTSQVIRNIVKSSKKITMLELLYTFLEGPDDHGRNGNVVLGAVETFTDIVRSHDRKKIPELSFPRLVDCLQAVPPRRSGRLNAATLELCANILDGGFASICIEEPDWTTFSKLLNECSGGSGQEVTDSAQSPVVSPTRSVSHDDHLAASISRLSSLIEQLWDQLSSEQKSAISPFLRISHRHLSPTQARLLINHLKMQRSYFPGTEDWAQDAKWLVDSFLRTPGKLSDVRVFALEALEDTMFQDNNLVSFEQAGVIDSLLQNFADEKDTIYLSSLVSVMIEIAARADNDIFHTVVDTLSSPMTSDFLEEDDPAILSGQLSQSRRNSGSVLEPSLSNVCMMGLVRLFLRFLNVSAERAALLFETLIFIVKTSKKRPADATLTVLKLLFRLRCDSSGAIWVTADIENDFLVAVLSRNLDVGVKQTTAAEGSILERSSMHSDDSLTATTARLSLRNPSVSTENQRSVSRMSSSYLRGTTKSMPPSWMQVDSSLPDEPSTAASPFVYAYKTTAEGTVSHMSEQNIEVLKVNVYLETIIDLLQKRDTPWDVYSYILAHLGPQLSNRDLFSNAVPQIQMLRNILCGQIKGEMFREPPAIAGIKKADVAICIFDCLAMLVGFHHYFAKSEQDELVRAFMLGIGSWDGTSRGCIHALSVCCHEIPLSVTKSLNMILDKMSKVITMAHVAVHILEFLALLARLPEVYVNLREEEIRTVFGICIRFIQTSREQRLKASDSSTRPGIPARLSGGLRDITTMQLDSAETNTWQEGMSIYVYTLTYHVLVFWFLSLKLQDRANHVNWITNRLIFTDELGQEVVEEQTEVFIDLMQRVTYSDLGDTIPYETFPPSPEDGPVTSKSWIVGMSIVTVETAGVSGLTQITKRMASGTTYAEYRQRTAPVLPHQIPPTPDTLSTLDSTSRTAILPSHVLLQMVTTAFPTPRISQPIPLPDDAMTRRAISSFDRNDIVDGHKVGVIFLDNNQTTEAEILANTAGSPDYDHFLNGLGTRVSIRGAQFNTQGLHSDIDGEFTYAWRDRVTEMVYHVTTMMPTNLETDPACVAKKRHVGNDFVNIIFNRSNRPFNFDTIPSQFNSINIVITPVCRIAESDFNHDTDTNRDYDKSFYVVRVMNKPGLPELSPASTPKVISGKSLAAYVRILAINASVFSLVWNREGGEHISSWRNRLREIKRLRERAMTARTASVDASESGFLGHRRNTRANIHSEDETVAGGRAHQTRPDMGGESNIDNHISQALDFSRWTR